MKLLERIRNHIQQMPKWHLVMNIVILINILITIFFMFPKNNCDFWVDNLASAGLPNISKSFGGCYQVAFKYEEKQDYAKAKHYFSEAARKAQVMCDKGKTNGCNFAEECRKQFNRIVELEKNK